MAEEQARVRHDGNSGDGFVSARVAAAETVMATLLEMDGKPIVPPHPMFRRTSSDATSQNKFTPNAKVDTGQGQRSKGRARVAAGVGIIEVLSSDEDEKSDRLDVTVNAISVAGENKAAKSEPGTRDSEEGLGSPPAQDEITTLTPLTFFLQISMLSTDTSSEQDDAFVPKVTITTVHAAKGLEWPVVFVPAVEQGTYPSYRCTEAPEIAEERRLLYVAMTRSQIFLTVSHCQFRMMGGEDSEKALSEFVGASVRRDAATFSTDLPEIDLAVRRNIATMLGRDAPDEEATKEMIMKHVRSAPPLSMWDAPEARDNGFNRFARREVTKAARAAEYWSSDFDEYALRDPKNSVGWRSARAAPRNKPSNPSSPRPPAPPPVKLPPTNHKLPEPLPFTFGAVDTARPQANLGVFTDHSSTSLLMMKSLGLPGEDSPMTSPMGSPQPTSVSTFQSAAKNSMSDWKDLAPPDITAKTAGAGVQLAKGTKRLGMGRPVPYGVAGTNKRSTAK